MPRNSVKDCIDVDLCFTPATNLIVLRRLALKVGQRAEAPAAYLKFPEMRLVKLPQSYLRISRSEYAYEAPTVGYAGTLRVLPNGAVTRYPGLFEMVAAS
ncbi:MAG: putative glycolipid-binding domain-containing protein [Nitrospirota bacterium]